jgi:hypothetical protein
MKFLKELNFPFTNRERFLTKLTMNLKITMCSYR